MVKDRKIGTECFFLVIEKTRYTEARYRERRKNTDVCYWLLLRISRNIKKRKQRPKNFPNRTIKRLL